MIKENEKLSTDSRIDYPVRLLSLEGACKYLSCSGDLLEELISQGDIPVIRLGREPRGRRDRCKRWVDRLDLDNFIEERKIKRVERHYQ
ncbi:excisionase family DNA-binding protein [Thermodesulfobacteriota bacterium]